MLGQPSRKALAKDSEMDEPQLARGAVLE